MGKFLLRTFASYLLWTFLRHTADRTNATFFRKATRQMHEKDQRPPAWHWLPGYIRALVKLAVFLALVGLPVLWWYDPDTATTLLRYAAVTAVLSAGTAVWVRIRDRKHFRNYVEPLHRSLRSYLGHDPGSAGDWLTVPHDFQSCDGEGVRLQLPPDLNLDGDQKARVLSIVGARLGVDHLGAQWHDQGREPYAVFRPVPQAPTSCTLADVQEAITAAPDTAPVIGMAKQGRIVSIDLEDESPHVLISAGSGGGKSVLAKAMIAQFLNRGARVVIMDRKRISHRWAKDLPGVEYYRDTEQIHDALIGLAKEGDRRNRLTDDSDDVEIGGRIVVVFEEMNATTGKLTNFWTATREKDDPKRSPAVEALGDLVNMGRQVHMHVIAIGQRIETRTLGGGDVRESFGIRCLSRYSVQTWKMLCADVWPMPKKSSTRGRWQIVTNGETTETQVAFLSDEEAQGLARAGRSAADQADTPGTRKVGTGVHITQREAFGADYERLRKAMQRDPDAPEPIVSGEGVTNLYVRADIDAWRRRYDSRPRLSKDEVSA